MYESVVIGLDLGVEADRALPIAHALARRLGARLEALVVSTRGVDPADDEREVAAHAKASGVVLYGVRLRYDEDVAVGLLAEAADGDSLLCLAPRARGAVTEAILGSVSTDVVRQTTQPLLLVGPDVVTSPLPPFGAVLACVDGARGTDHVAAVAGRWAAALDVRAHVLRVEPDEDTAAAARRCPSGPADVAAGLAAGGVDASWQVLAHERPEEQILASAAQLDGPVIVTGHDASRLRRGGLGDVGSTVVRDALFPVLVVPFRI